MPLENEITSIRLALLDTLRGIDGSAGLWWTLKPDRVVWSRPYQRDLAEPALFVWYGAETDVVVDSQTFSSASEDLFFTIWGLTQSDDPALGSERLQQDVFTAIEATRSTLGLVCATVLHVGTEFHESVFDGVLKLDRRDGGFAMVIRARFDRPQADGSA